MALEQHGAARAGPRPQRLWRRGQDAAGGGLRGLARREIVLR